MATLALNSGLWVRRLLIGGSPFQGRCPASKANDGACPEKPVHLNRSIRQGLRELAYDIKGMLALGGVTEARSTP